jgi:hypothetical protein
MYASMIHHISHYIQSLCSTKIHAKSRQRVVADALPYPDYVYLNSCEHPTLPHNNSHCLQIFFGHETRTVRDFERTGHLFHCDPCSVCDVALGMPACHLAYWRPYPRAETPHLRIANSPALHHVEISSWMSARER